jgi:hypothetical protein
MTRTTEKHFVESLRFFISISLCCLLFVLSPPIVSAKDSSLDLDPLRPADTQPKDHAMQDIARANNDTLYIGCMLDLRKDPVILIMPAFDSRYVSLMITGYDHYVNIPMSTRLQKRCTRPLRQRTANR